VTEKAFTAQVIQLARLYGWLVAHFRPAMTAHGWRTAVQGDGAGFPDLLLVHPKRGLIVAAELKVGKNRMTEEQTRWIGAFAVAGVQAYTWYPEHWSQIEAVLQARDAPVTD